MKLIYITKVQDVREDILIGKEVRKGFFSVKWYYNSLCVESRVEFLVKEIWGSHAPWRSCFCTWEAVWGKI